jgi:hypothetical protein
MRLCAIFLLLFSIVLGSVVRADFSGTLRGKITDPSGAVVPQATVTATGADGKTATVQSNHDGVYEIRGLAPGSYTVTAVAKGFALDTEADVQINPGQTQDFDIQLQIAVEQQHVEVQEESPTVAVSPENSAGTIVLKGKDLDALSDDPDELQSEWKRWLDLLRDLMAARFTSTVSPPGSFRRSRPSAKSASTRIPSPPSTTSSAMEESRSSPSREPTSFTANSW